MTTLAPYIHNANFVQCVLDAGGSPTQLAEQISWQRLLQAGVPMTSTNAVVTELIKVPLTACSYIIT